MPGFPVGKVFFIPILTKDQPRAPGLGRCRFRVDTTSFSIAKAFSGVGGVATQEPRMDCHHALPEQRLDVVALDTELHGRRGADDHCEAGRERGARCARCQVPPDRSSARETAPAGPVTAVNQTNAGTRAVTWRGRTTGNARRRQRTRLLAKRFEREVHADTGRGVDSQPRCRTDHGDGGTPTLWQLRNI